MERDVTICARCHKPKKHHKSWPMFADDALLCPGKINTDDDIIWEYEPFVDGLELVEYYEQGERNNDLS